MIWVVVHLNQYRSEHNIGSVHFGLCWQAWVVVCEFWCFGNSLSKGGHSRMALWHHGLIHEKFQWWRNYCEIFDVLDVLAIVWCDSWRWCYAEHWACDAKVGSWLPCFDGSDMPQPAVLRIEETGWSVPRTFISWSRLVIHDRRETWVPDKTLWCSCRQCTRTHMTTVCRIIC